MHKYVSGKILIYQNEICKYVISHTYAFDFDITFLIQNIINSPVIQKHNLCSYMIFLSKKYFMSISSLKVIK